MFDPYHKWLGIPPGQRPPTHYQLLGIDPQEQDREVIEEAAIRQTAHVRTYQMGAHAAECTRLLNEIAQARTVLLNPARRKEYDARLARAAAKARPTDEGIKEGPAPLVAEVVPAEPAAEAFAFTAEPDGPVVSDDGPVSVKLPSRGSRAPARNRQPVPAAGGVAARVGLFVAVAAGGVVGLVIAYFLFIHDSGKTSNEPGNGGADPKALVQGPNPGPPNPAVPPAPNPAVGPNPAPAPQPQPGPAPADDKDNTAFKRRPPFTVNHLTISADGRRALSAASTLVQLWELPSGKELRRLPHAAGVTCVALSADGRRALTGTGGVAQNPDGKLVPVDCKVRLWDLDKGVELKRFPHPTPVQAVAFAPGGGQALSGSGRWRPVPNGNPIPEDCVMRLWDLDTGGLVQTFRGHEGPVHTVAFAPDGREGFSLCLSGPPRRWDLKDGRELAALPVRPFRAVFVARGRVVGLEGAAVRVWDREGRPVRSTGPLPSAVNCLAASADGRRALVGSGHLVFENGQPLRRDGQLVFRDCTVRLLDMDRGRPLAAFAGHRQQVTAVALSRDGRYGLSASSDGDLRLWDLKQYLPTGEEPEPDRQPESQPQSRPQSRPVVVARAPVPDAAALEQATRQVREHFKKSFARHRPADRRDLAARLLEEADKTSDDPAARFVLYREAADLAAKAGDAGLAVTAAEALARDYAVDALEVKAGAVEAAGQAAATAVAHRAVAEKALDLLEEALAAENFDTARRLAACAGKAAGRAGSPALAKVVKDRAGEVDEFRKQYEAAGQARKRLRDKPDDPKANRTAGRYLCLWKGDWGKGLPLLARGDDAALRDLAGKELAGPPDPAGREALGDGWKKRAGKEEGPPRVGMLRRAVHWYEKALADLKGLTRTRVEQKVKAVEELPELQGPAVVGEFRRLPGHGDRVTGVALTRDGRFALSGGADGAVRLWEVKTGKEVRRFRGPTVAVNAVALSPDGKQAAAAGSTGTLWVWDVGREMPVRQQSWGGNPIECLQFSADGRLLVFGTDNGVVFKWPLTPEAGGFFSTSNRAWGQVRSVALSPDNQMLLFADLNGKVQGWDLKQNAAMSRTLVYASPVLCLAFSPDGRYLATGGADRTVRLWNVRTGLVKAVLKGHKQAVTSLAFSADSRRLLSGGADKTVRLWDVKTRKLIKSFTGHTGKVTGVALSGDGRLGASAGEDRVVILWRLPK